MATTTCILNNGVWLSGGTWDNGIPGVGDKAVITGSDIDDAALVPLPPASDTTIQDLEITAARGTLAFDGSAHLTVSRNVTVTPGGGTSTCAIKIKTQTGAGTLAFTTTNSAIVFTATSAAGTITTAGGNGTTLNIATTTGSLTLGSGLVDLVNGQVNGHLHIPGVPQVPVSTVTWGGSAILSLTGTSPGYLTCPVDDEFTGPATINSAGDLVIIAPQGGGLLNLSGVAIHATGSVTIEWQSPGPSQPVLLEGATITGPSTVGAQFKDHCAPDSGSYTVTGFEPLYKVGNAGATLSARGASGVIKLPSPSDVNTGVTYGKDDGTTGTLVASGGGGGGGSLGLGL